MRVIGKRSQLRYKRCSTLEQKEERKERKREERGEREREREK